MLGFLFWLIPKTDHGIIPQNHEQHSVTFPCLNNPNNPFYIFLTYSGFFPASDLTRKISTICAYKVISGILIQSFFVRPKHSLSFGKIIDHPEGISLMLKV